MKECPFCLRALSNDLVECPYCHNRVDMFRTGFYARPDLPKSKAAAVWIVAAAAVIVLAVAIAESCASRSHGRPAKPEKSAARAVAEAHP
jgi:hypothetical protein